MEIGEFRVPFLLGLEAASQLLGALGSLERLAVVRDLLGAHSEFDQAGTGGMPPIPACRDDVRRLLLALRRPPVLLGLGDAPVLDDRANVFHELVERRLVGWCRYWDALIALVD